MTDYKAIVTAIVGLAAIIIGIFGYHISAETQGVIIASTVTLVSLFHSMSSNTNKANIADNVAKIDAVKETP